MSFGEARDTKASAVAALVVPEQHRLRSKTERFIREIYHEEYGATLGGFPTRLITILDERGEILCAAGLRSRDDGFFSERYLNSPIEAALGRLRGEVVRRDRSLRDIDLRQPFAPFRSALRRPSHRIWRRCGLRMGLFHPHAQVVAASESNWPRACSAGRGNERAQGQLLVLGQLLRDGSESVRGESGQSHDALRHPASARRECVRSTTRCDGAPRLMTQSWFSATRRTALHARSFYRGPAH